MPKTSIAGLNNSDSKPCTCSPRKKVLSQPTWYCTSRPRVYKEATAPRANAAAHTCTTRSTRTRVRGALVCIQWVVKVASAAGQGCGIFFGSQARPLAQRPSQPRPACEPCFLGLNKATANHAYTSRFHSTISSSGADNRSTRCGLPNRSTSKPTRNAAMGKPAASAAKSLLRARKRGKAGVCAPTACSTRAARRARKRSGRPSSVNGLCVCTSSHATWERCCRCCGVTTFRSASLLSSAQANSRSRAACSFMERDYLTEISSISKFSVAFGGITPPAPRSP